MRGVQTLKRLNVTAILIMLLAIPADADTASLRKTDSVTSPWAAPMLLGVHRGGLGQWPENTVMAFRAAADRSPKVLLEGDLRLSRDGAVVMIHDARVDRTTNGAGAVADLTLAELQALDAGYRFSPDNGATFPFRGQGVTIPTLAEVLEAAPKHRILLELKAGDGIAGATARILQAHDAVARSMIASFDPALMAAMRKALPGIATCYDRPGVLALFAALRLGDWDRYTPTDKMLSLPKRYVDQLSLTAEEIARMQAKGILVQVHTVNKPAEYQRFRNMGVDSILTDYPTRMVSLENHDAAATN